MKRIYYLLIPALLSLIMAGCSKYGSQSYISVQLDGSNMWSLMNVSDGETVMTNEFFSPASNIVEGAVFVENDNKEFNLYNLKDTKNRLNRRPFDIVSNFSNDGHALVQEKGAPWEIIDTKGDIVALLDKSLSVLTGFSEDNLAVVKDVANGKIGYINSEGQIVISPRYEFGSIFSNGVAMVYTTKKDGNNLYSAIDKAGNVLFTYGSNQYSSIGLFNDGYALAVAGENCVLIDKAGARVLTVCKGTDISKLGYKDGKIIFSEGDFFGLKDINDRVLIRPKYKELKFQEDGDLIAVNSNGMYGVVSDNDDDVIPFNYEDLVYISSGRYVARSGAVRVLIDKKGKEVGKKAFSNYLNRTSDMSAMERTTLICAKNNRGVDAMAADAQVCDLKLNDLVGLNALYQLSGGGIYPGDFKGIVNGKDPVVMQILTVNGSKVFGNINYTNSATGATIKSTPFFGFIKEKTLKLIAKGQKDNTYDEDWNLDIGDDKLTGTITTSSGKTSAVSVEL